MPSLPATLRSLGGFDQPYDPQNRSTLQALASEAASATSRGLIGAQPQDPVPVGSESAQRPAALVVPLTNAPSSGGGAHLVGLVAFLLDCSGRAYFSAVDDLSARGPSGPGGFPAVGQDVAARRLRVANPMLVYATTPFTPLWRNPQNGATLPAV